MKTRFTELTELLAALPDPEDRQDGLELLQQYADHAADYYVAVCRMETGALTLRYQMDPEAYRAAAMDRDRARTRCHDALIASTRAMNRFLLSLGQSPFYAGDEQDRYAVASFAGEVLSEIYQARSQGLRPS